MKKITEQKDVFIMNLQMLYDTEKELEKTLPKLAKSATDIELSENLQLHLEATKEQANRLEKIFDMLGVNISKMKSEGIRGITDDASTLLKINASTSLKDSLIASSARYTEHYEIAGYENAMLLAKELGLYQINELLKESLNEEKGADKKLEQAIQKYVENTELVL